MRWEMLGVVVGAIVIASGCGRQEVFTFERLGGSDAGETAPNTADAEPAGDAIAAPSDPDAGPIMTPDSGPTPVPDAGPGPRDATPTPPADGGSVADAAPVPDTGVIADAGVPDTGPPRQCNADSDCRALGTDRDICEPAGGTCVECLVDTDCRRGRTCDVAGGNICRFSCGFGRCPPGLVCDTAADLCVDCLADDDCNSDSTCDQATRTCVECRSNADCAGTVATPICDPGSNTCLGCVSDSDCIAPQTCDSDENFCRTNTGRALCTPCNDDDQCGGADDLCIGYVFGPGNFVDRTCSQDCTNSPCPRGFDCISTRRGSAQQCRPRYEMRTPTCEAERNLGQACTFAPNDPDPGCGISGVQDARCVQTMSGGSAGVCTIWCDDNDDCPASFACVGASGGDPGNCL